MSEKQGAPTERVLHPASEGDDVRALQTALFNAGYHPGPVDGVYGPATKAAVEEFQQRALPAPWDGRVTPQVWRELAGTEGGAVLTDQPLTRVLEGASEGPDVAELQRALRRAGQDPGPPDGVFGPGTFSSLRRYQSYEGLPVTGVLDAATRRRLMPVRLGDHLLNRRAADVVAISFELTSGNPERDPDTPSLFIAALHYAINTDRDPVLVGLCNSLPGLEDSLPDAERNSRLSVLEEQEGLKSGGITGEYDIEGETVRPPLTDILTLADTLALQDRSGDIEPSHLMVALVSGLIEELPVALTEKLSVPQNEIKGRLAAVLSGQYPDEDPLSAWWSLPLDVVAPPTSGRTGGSQQAPAPQAPEEPAEPANFLLGGGITGDVVPGLDPGAPIKDELNVKTYVSMLASAIADRNTPMPLSIGLFGEWGTGKSYFMSLLQQEVRNLSKSAGADGSPYLPDIVHINFNAWHYSDANLWASLADEIFEQLAGRDGADDNQERREGIRRELSENLNKRRELENSTKQAEAEAARLRARLDTERVNHDASALNLAKALLDDEEVRTKLAAAGRTFGITEPEKVQLLAEELARTRDETRSAWRMLREARWSARLVLTVLLILVLIPGSVWLADRLGFQWPGFAGLATAVAGITTVLSTLRKGVVAFQAGVRKAQELKTTAGNRDLQAKVDELNQAEARVRVGQAQLEEVVAKVGRLGQQLTDLNPGSRLYAFLAERAASADYQGQLGIVSMIRKDFQQLVDLMASWAKAREESGRDPDVPSGALPPPPLDRIVLYIDDLDRCEPSQVVDVLQAVHLLLAMNLFVVVVGVDPRWLLRSLRMKYSGVMGAADPDQDEGFRQSTPNDYLEKIFNIPVVLPAMDKPGFSRLIRKMAFGESGPPVPRAAGPAAKLPPQPEVTAPGATPPTQELAPVVADRSSGPDVPQPSATKAAAEPGPPVAGPPAATATASPLVGEAGSVIDDIVSGKAPTVRPLTDTELDFLDDMGSLVRTPRSAKRMFNLYRMLRSARSVEEASAFLGTRSRPGEYQAVAQLLAVLTAQPRVLGAMITARPGGINDPARLGGLLFRDPDELWSDFVGGLTLVRNGPYVENSLLTDIPENQVKDWLEIVTALNELLPKVTLDRLEPYQEWAPQVARFSFLLSPFAADVEIPPKPEEDEETTHQPSPA